MHVTGGQGGGITRTHPWPRRPPPEPHQGRARQVQAWSDLLLLGLLLVGLRVLLLALAGLLLNRGYHSSRRGRGITLVGRRSGHRLECLPPLPMVLLFTRPKCIGCTVSAPAHWCSERGGVTLRPIQALPGGALVGPGVQHVTRLAVVPGRGVSGMTGFSDGDGGVDTGSWRLSVGLRPIARWRLPAALICQILSTHVRGLARRRGAALALGAVRVRGGRWYTRQRCTRGVIGGASRVLCL